MATLTISLPEPLGAWVEAQVERGDHASASDYVGDLIRRDRAKRSHPELTIEDLRRMVAESEASGVGNRSMETIKAEAKAIIARRRANG